jgi:hypothetical protein
MEMTNDYTGPPRSAATPIHRSIIDSALVLAVLYAICYAVGHLVEIRDSSELGIPHHLLPELQMQSIVLTGALHLLLMIVGLLFLYLVLLLVSRVIPAGIKLNARNYIKEAVKRHPITYALVGALAIIAAILVSAFGMPLSNSWRYDDQHLPRVIAVHIRPEQPRLETAGLLYLCHRDGYVVLKRTGKKEYVVIKADDVASLVLGSEAKATYD